jgi:hypothetical protein
MNQSLIHVTPYGDALELNTDFIVKLITILERKLKQPLSINWWFYRVDDVNCFPLDIVDIHHDSFSIIILITGRFYCYNIDNINILEINSIEIEVIDSIDAIFLIRKILLAFDVSELSIGKEGFDFNLYLQ